MSIRAVVLGLAGAAAICGFTYFNDHVIRQTFLVGSCVPPAVFGTLIVLLVLVNPALAYLKKRLAFSGAELAVVLALTLVACCIPSAGLMESFPNVVMMPHHVARTDAGWRAEKATEMVPGYMLADISGDEDRALNGFVQGLSHGQESIGLGDVPWSAWARTLAFWLPLVVLMWMAMIGISVVIHRQWSDHEQLPYPIATFTEALLPGGEEDDRPVYRQRLFWIGCGAVCFVHLVNYAHAWWPEAMVTIPRRFDLTPLADLLPTLARAGGRQLFRITLYFTVIGLAFFLPKDVSFSLGIGPVLYFYVAGVLAGFGVSMTGRSGGWYSLDLRRSLQAGGYAGMFLLIIYTGRRYYASVLRSALGLGTPDAVERQAVWGARVFMVCTLLFAGVLTFTGLDWQLALLFTALSVVMFIVIARVSAQTGYVFVHPFWEPAALIVGFMGMRALGPSTALILFLVSTVVLLDTREPLVAFVVNSFRVLERRKVRVGRVAGFGALALVVGLSVAVPVTLYLMYDRGTNLSMRWSSQRAPRFSFDEAVRIKQRLRAQGVLEEAESVSGWRRLLAVSPSGTLLVGFGAALCLFLVLSMLRLRFPAWPLHPIFLLLWGSGTAPWFVGSVLIGCLVKWGVLKYGGDSAYRRVKPVMIGLVAGDMLFGVTTSVIGGVYFLVTGEPPPRFVAFVG